MNTLFLEPFGGLAGDMLLAALLDLRDPRFSLAHLAAIAKSLVGEEARLSTEEVERGGLRATLLRVETPEGPGGDGPPHRHLADMAELLARAPLGPAARLRAERILVRLAAAEADVHGIDIEEVHFHEVGAVDTLIDVAGAVLALERLKVERVHAEPPLVGSGMVRCAHGLLPVPAPGTAAILRGLPHVTGGTGERLTPTGAALLAELVDSFEPPGFFVAGAIGYGAGASDPKDGPPNLVRAQLGVRERPGKSARAGQGPVEAWLLEVNLDDATGEEIGFLLEELRRAGALEAWSAPIHMKKDRPAAVVSALARAERRAALEAVVFSHSPTLGLRWTRVERTECARETLSVELPDLKGESVRVKVRRRPGVAVTALDLSPEHEDLAKAARASGQALRELERRAVELALEALGAEEALAKPRAHGRGRSRP